MDERSACLKKLSGGEAPSSVHGSSLYSYLFEHAPMGIIHFNQQGIITSCNDNFVDIIGSTRNKLLGKDLTTLPNQQLHQAISKALSGERSTFEGVYKTITSDRQVPIRVEFHPVQDHGGVELGIGMVQDMTEQYRAKEKIRESEQRYQTIFTQNHHVVLLIDMETGVIKDANAAALKFYGWSKNQLRSMKISDINVLSAKQVEREMEKARREEKNSFYFKHRLANGAIRDVEVYSGLVRFDEEMCLYTIVHDITDRLTYHRELLKFKLGIERSSNIIFITDREGRIEYVNPSFTREYGYRLRDVKGKTPRVLKSGKHSDQFYEEFWKTISGGKEMQGELINKTKDGENLNIRFSSNPIINDEGYNIGYIAIQENITERKKKDQELRESLEEKKLLLSEIHHRVKNNMAIISGLLELNLYQDNKEGIEEFIKNSQFRIKAMANVHELLYRSDTFSTIPFKAYLDELVNYMTSAINKCARAPEISIDVDDVDLNINQAIPCGLMMNELILHYIKYQLIDPDSPQISINLEKEGEQLCLTVKGNSAGKSKEHFTETESFGMTLINVFKKQLEADMTMRSIPSGYETVISFQERKHLKGAASSFM